MEKETDAASLIVEGSNISEINEQVEHLRSLWHPDGSLHIRNYCECSIVPGSIQLIDVRGADGSLHGRSYMCIVKRKGA